MKIKSIKIENLFEIFNYNIEYKEDENILILTGPNGFGKTQILNIVYSAFNGGYFFPNLVFDKITILLENGMSLEIINNKKSISYLFKENDELIGNHILSSINAHFIQEQRLFKKVNNLSKNLYLEKDQSIMMETIRIYAKKLAEFIANKAVESYHISQELDKNYPNRLISEKRKISQEEYEAKFHKLKEKQTKLSKVGLYEGKQEEIAYSAEDAKALLVYLNDFEQKLSVFDDLLEKLELFTTILNERRFTFKTIQIDREKGFYFRTSTNKELDLAALSSGEQHEVVLLYELIFNTTPNTIVLIDEPEISLHITWQKEFLKDLIKIVKMQNFQVLIATHSPSIINDRWDLVYNLEKTDN